MPRIQRFAHAVQRFTYVQFFKPEQRDFRPDDLVVRGEGEEENTRYAAWKATSYSGFVPFQSPPSR